jgi:hypothetical protein
VLSNDNGESVDTSTMDVTKEITTTPTTYLAATPAASLKPLAQSASHGSASEDTSKQKMAVMADKCIYSRMTEVNEESK